MNGNPQGEEAVLRGPPSGWKTMQPNGQEYLDATASAPCEGCLNGYGCYNDRPCLNYAASSYPQPTMYNGQQPIMPYFLDGREQRSMPLNYGSAQPANQPYYEHLSPTPHQPQFIGYHPHPHPAQQFYYGQSATYGNHYYPGPPMKAPYYTNRYQRQSRRNSRPRRSSAGTNYGHEQSISSLDFSDSISSTFTGNEVRQAIAFVRTNPNATLFSIEGENHQIFSCYL